MSHKSRSLVNSRHEAKRIYMQRIEINRLKQKNEKLNDDKRGMLIQLYKANNDKDDYKSRCEKAIEYMKENNFHYMNEYALERFRNDLLNILQNGSDKKNGL